jgi:hypothetical protein
MLNHDASCADRTGITGRVSFSRTLALAGLPVLLALGACGSPADDPDPAATTMDPYPVDAMEDGMMPAPTTAAVPPAPLPVPAPPMITPPETPEGVETGTATMRGPGTDAPPAPATPQAPAP